MMHVNITVKGYVQGVGFRYYTLRTAKQAGIRGFVMNMPNGNVYIEAEGEPYQIEDFIDHIRIGPMSSEVADVHIEDGPTSDYSDFSIR